MHRFGSLGGTNTAAAVAAHFRRGKHARVVIVTDEQAMGPVSPARAVPDDVPLYTWNLAGHRDHVQVHQVGARAAALTGVRVVEATVPRELVRRLGRLLLLLRLLRRHTLDEMRGYGTHTTLAHKWQDVLARRAFTPCLQYQYAAGKNTADIALALDALEALLDGRADTFCLVTSDSDFGYLCRKLSERGATVCLVGEPKTPDALRNASDCFSEWKSATPRPAVQKPAVKRNPLFIVEAVALLAAGTSDGKVPLQPLGSHFKRTRPDFSSKTYGHSRLLAMLKTYDQLQTAQDAGGNWTVSLTPSAAAG